MRRIIGIDYFLYLVWRFPSSAWLKCGQKFLCFHTWLPCLGKVLHMLCSSCKSYRKLIIINYVKLAVCAICISIFLLPKWMFLIKQLTRIGKFGMYITTNIDCLLFWVGQQFKFWVLSDLKNHTMLLSLLLVMILSSPWAYNFNHAPQSSWQSMLVKCFTFVVQHHNWLNLLEA